MLEAEVAYFMEDCSHLTNEQKQNLTTEFLRILQSKGICQSTCQVTDVEVTCGLKVSDTDFFDNWDLGLRKKRSTQSGLKFHFKMVSTETSALDADCSSFCGQNDVNDDCLNDCAVKYKSDRVEALQQSANQVKTLYQEPASEEELVVEGAGLRLMPMKGAIVQPPQVKCGEGMVLNNLTNNCGKLLA